MGRICLLGLLVASLLGACSSPPATVSPIPTSAGSFGPRPPASGPVLRTVDVSGTACAGIGVTDGTLHGNPQDPRVAWLDLGSNGTRDLVFPLGFTARFEPRLEILDAGGGVRFRDGDTITEGCVWGDSLLLGWP